MAGYNTRPSTTWQAVFAGDHDGGKMDRVSFSGFRDIIFYRLFVYEKEMSIWSDCCSSGPRLKAVPDDFQS